MLIFTRAASLVNTFFKMAQGKVVKERSRKRIFHLAEANAELCFADLHPNARECLCVPGDVASGLRGQVKKREEMGKEKRGVKKKVVTAGGTMCVNIRGCSANSTSRRQI